MMSLTEEQIKKIKENKAAALLKKQQSMQKAKTSSNDPPQTYNAVKSLSDNKPKTKSNGHNRSPPLPMKVNFKVFGPDRFLVEMPYHSASIEVFKVIPGKKYEVDLKKWSFPFSEHNNLAEKLKLVNSEMVINEIPESVLKVLSCTDSEDHSIDWSKIDKTLRNRLMAFQVEGIRFGVSKKGKCLIADEMGLGKTIQALGVMHYFKENWPLLIVCPSSMKFPWQEAINEFLPSVKESVTVLSSGKIQCLKGEIVISSYDLMKNYLDDFIKKNFGAIIFDESHSLKSLKTARTKAALQLCRCAKNVVLLSGTPALSRPNELFPQIFAIDPWAFKSFFEFGMRYCDGKKDRFGWNFLGSSNLEELELYLKKKIMIRRLKAEVIKQLPSKIRKLVILHPNMVKSISKEMEKLEKKFSNQKGVEKQSTLLSYYSVTGDAKLKAVCEYIEDKLENTNKFLIFAHHTNVLNGLCDLLDKKNLEYIRIDGSVPSETRKALCDRFQSQDDCRVAVLSIKAANCGITLTAAQLVIFAELYWNPGELTQAEDRVHRIGQEDSVLVEYLVARGTADEHLWSLVQSKLNILNKAGLSKDNFKNTDTEQLNDPKHLTINSFFVKKEDDKGNQETKMEDDDIFDSINLDEIENEYQLTNKKRKTSLEL